MKLTRRQWIRLASACGAVHLWGKASASPQPEPWFTEVPGSASGIDWVHENAMSPSHYLPEARARERDAVTVAAVLNAQATQLDPGIVPGKYQAPFANLAFAQKAEVFRRLEAIDSPEAGALRFLAGNLPGLVAFLVYADRKVGWKLSRYSGVADGRKEFKGYFHA